MTLIAPTPTAADAAPDASRTSTGGSHGLLTQRNPLGSSHRPYVFPGSTGWLSAVAGNDQEHPIEEEDLAVSMRQADLIALPVAWVISYPLWLETTSPKDIPDLLALQCERRGISRGGENPTHRIVRNTENRTLVQVLAVSPKLPEPVYQGIDSRYEASPRCREFPAGALCVWRELGRLCVALTPQTADKQAGEMQAEPVHFQAWPHREIQDACLTDLRVLLLVATAQEWTEPPKSCFLIGDFTEQDRLNTETALDLPTYCKKSTTVRPPPIAMDLSPSAVRLVRQQRRRQRQLWRTLSIVAILYLLFLCYEIFTSVSLSLTNRHLQRELDHLTPAVQEMQNTARLMDTLRPVMQPDLFPLEILRHVMEALPESGVRLTRFEILQGNLEIAGEASTAREAFTFLTQVQALEPPDLIVWESPPPPVPLPNNTTRFSLRGVITEAYRDPDET